MDEKIYQASFFNRSFLFFIVYLFLVNIVQAQGEFRDGFIITNSGDTLYGQVSLASNAVNCRKCEFRENPDATITTYLPGEIMAYRIWDEKYYITREIVLNNKTEKVFLEYLVNGIADLYYYKTFDKEYYYIEKEGELFQLSNDKRIVRGEDINSTTPVNKTFYESQNKKYVGILNYLFRDAKGLSSEINKTRYEYKALIRLTRKYHRMVCNEYECITYSRSIRTRLAVEPTVAVINSQMTHLKDAGELNSLTFGAGVNFRIKPVRAYNHWNLVTGLSWSGISFSGQLNREETSDILRYKTINLKYDMLSIPLTLEYSFLTGRIQPFLQAGAEGFFLLNPYHTIDLYMNEHIGTIDFIQTSRPDNNTYDFSKLDIGIQAGAGIRYSLNEKLYLQGRLQYQQRTPLIKLGSYYEYLTTRSWIYSLSMGINLD